MNKKIKVLLVVTLLILMVGCSKKLKWSNPEAQLNETTKIKEIKEFGIPIEKYTYILTDDMKLRNESIQAVIDRIPELKEAFKRSKNRIDLTKNINVIPYSNYYNETSQEYTINVLIVNTSNESILSGSFDVHSVLSLNLKVFEGGPTKFTELVKELRPMAYRNEIKQMTEYIQKTYPQYEAYAPNMLDAANKINPFISISLATPIKQAERMENAKKEKDTIFMLYKENSSRSDDEWKEIFQQMNYLDYAISVQLVLKESEILPSDNDANEVLKDIKNNSLFSGYYAYAAIIESNLQDTKRNAGLVRVNKVYNPDLKKVGDS